MSSSDRSAAEPDSARSSSSIQRSLVFDGPGRRRDENELLHCLTNAIRMRLSREAPELDLKKSFGQAMVGLGAEKGVFLRVRQEGSLDVEILSATGLSPQDEAACCELRPSHEIAPTLIRQAIENAQARLIEDSSAPGLDAIPSLRSRPLSVLCAPVADSLTGGVVAVLYFQNEARLAFEAEDLEWLGAYAAVLGQALPCTSRDSSGSRSLRLNGGVPRTRMARSLSGTARQHGSSARR